MGDPHLALAALALPKVQVVTLSIEGKGVKANISWDADVLGPIESKFTAPYSDADTLALVLRALDAIQYPNHPTEGPQFTVEEQDLLTQLSLWQGGQVSSDAYKRVGRAIYRGLGSKGQSALEAVRNTGIAQNVPTSYVLRFAEESAALAALPWESITDLRNQPVLLSRGRGIDSCERYVVLPAAIPPPNTVGQKLHILALLPRWNIPDEIRDEEQYERQIIWNKLRDDGLITYHEINPLTRKELSDYLTNPVNPKPDIIHYFGHGEYRNGKGYLIFDKKNGDPDPVSVEKLSVVGLGDTRVAMLFACQSSQTNGGLLTGVAPALSVVGGAVVAMQLSLRIEEAIRFSEVFYRELLVRKRSLQDAVAVCRQTLFFEFEEQASWYVPTLYIRGRDQKPVYLVS